MSDEASRFKPMLQESLQIVLDELRSQCGEDYSAYKPSTVLRRVKRRMSLHGIHSLDDYLRLLRGHAEEAFTLADSLKIGLTEFFRDESTWEALREALVLKLKEPTTPDGDPASPWRLWVCGCATGEEAYSWAMVLTEAFERAGSFKEVQIFATDADARAIDKARRGVFSRSIEAQMSQERLLHYFTPDHQGWRVKPELRGMITFATHNALSDPPFGRLDFLSCRNLLMYLQVPAQKQILARLHRCLRLGGWLMLGQSESLGEAEDWFEPLHAQAPWLPLFRSRLAQTVLAAHPADMPAGQLLSGPFAGSVPKRLSSIFSGSHMSTPPEAKGSETDGPGTELSFEPAQGLEDERASSSYGDPAVDPANSAVSLDARAEIAGLRQSLAKARADLQLTRAQAQQTREELMSRMEELQATHEELTTSFEEMRTLADALAQARRQAEVSLAHFGEVFDKAPVAYFTLSASGLISQANALAARFLGVEASLLPGHSLLQFVAESERQRLQEFFDEASRSRLPMACDLTLKAATTPERHLRAVANSSASPDVFLLALYDHSLSMIGEAADVPSVSLVAQSSGWAVVLTDLMGRIIWVNKAFSALSGFSREEAVGRVGAELLGTNREAANEAALAQLEEAAKNGRGIELELLNKKKDGTPLWSRARIDPVRNAQGEIVNYLGVHIDRTPHHLEKEKLRQGIRLMEACQHMTQLGAWELDLGSELMSWTRGIYRLFDVSPATFTPTLGNSLMRLRPADRQRVKEAIEAAVAEGKPIDLVVDIRTARGNTMQVRIVAAVRFEGNKAVKLYGAMQQVAEELPASDPSDEA